jgi:hypothetical protein
MFFLVRRKILFKIQCYKKTLDRERVWSVTKPVFCEQDKKLDYGTIQSLSLENSLGKIIYSNIPKTEFYYNRFPNKL